MLTKNTPNPVWGFVDNSLAKNRQRTGPLTVDKSPRTATYPPRDPLPTSSTNHLGFDIHFESQNQPLRLIPLLELTYQRSAGEILPTKQRRPKKRGCPAATIETTPRPGRTMDSPARANYPPAR